MQEKIKISSVAQRPSLSSQTGKYVVPAEDLPRAQAVMRAMAKSRAQNLKSVLAKGG